MRVTQNRRTSNTNMNTNKGIGMNTDTDTDTDTDSGYLLDPQVKLLRRDIREATDKLGPEEIKYLVRLYYQIQEYRKASASVVRELEKRNAPNAFLTSMKGRMFSIEQDIKISLDWYTDNDPIGEWQKNILGIGPILAAGLLMFIDIEKAPTAGHIWSYAGLNPGIKWEKGKKRPWNRELKVHCWKIGDSFVKVSGREKSLYGRIYRDRKALEVERNERGDFADQAEATLREKRIREPKTRAVYEDGKLPPQRIDLRARRVAVKLYLSHLHAVMYWYHHKELPPKPYALAHMGHAHMIEVPNPPWPEGLKWKE